MVFERSFRHTRSIAMTPLIDVVFLLLIFFMVSTTFTKETHLSIDLPEAAGEPGQVAEKQIEITIDKTANYALNEVALVNNKLETLKSGIQKLSDGDNKIPMIITADSQTPHQAVVTAMDAAGQLGFIHLSITTRTAGADDD